MAEVHPVLRLRTIDELSEAHEWLFQQQREGKIDAKSADALNTTLKGSVYLNGRLKLDAAKLWLTASIKKLEIPVGMLPPMT
jgi:hypothetical protein